MAHLLHIHIVTYAGNAHTLPYAVTAARRAWTASPITILDDARHPIPPSMQQDLENHPQIQYRPTHWERGGNLRGRTCLRGLLSEYRRSLRETEAPYVLKLDADTLVLKKSATDLVWSASAKPNRADRAKVIQDLPNLLLRLRSGKSN